ncbi:ssDNA endodeoxyribonuclease RAD2 [Saccharomyces eubayanus]|uniref:ssDNA endodeoxyribonuclease RAD2 n=1 Tax=Saccharomyces eubayanus TaxID=1080349 RepID=UPI0006C31735|nr:RAD2-like protein [Saccharomyces eubayanus]KOG99740.1 RAD2-like protein [Saccharomyces eubayanus]
MGVHSFWDIVGPSARPVRLESLEDKRMAVDASIWIYQFLKAVRDQEGNAVKNSHITGFFRRICKLLYFGIRPIFVFDGGVPVLKRETIRQRKERRQGKRDSAKSTARKLLAFQLQNASNDGAKKPVQHSSSGVQIFKPHDEWDLPDIPGFKYDKEDTRVDSTKTFEKLMNSIDNDGLEDIDLEAINPASAEFEELPKATQYLILSSLRLKSRLRMGYTKEQLETIFPNSMDFSKFQIDMVKRRNFFTQRLINTTGTQDGEASQPNGEVVNRISGQKDKEYKLTKTDTGWILGLGSSDGSEVQKAIVIDDKDSGALLQELNGSIGNGDVLQWDSSQEDTLKVLRDKPTDTTTTPQKKEDSRLEDDEDEFDEGEWEDVELKPKDVKPIEDFSIKAARLPYLDKFVYKAGSKSFLDKRHDQVSPTKNITATKINRINLENGEDEDEDDEDFLKQIEEIEVMEAMQRSKNEQKSKPKTADAERARSPIIQYGSLGVQPDRSQRDHVANLNNKSGSVIEKNSRATVSEFIPPSVPEDQEISLTEGEQNLNFISNKIPQFNFNNKNSLLFQNDTSNKKGELAHESKEKIPVPEIPSWFSSTTSQQPYNPYSTTNFVEDKNTTSERGAEDGATTDGKNYELLTGLNAAEMLENENNSTNARNNQKDTDLEVLSDKVFEDIPAEPPIETAVNDKEDANLESTSNEHREPLAFDYDFSEDEEDHIVENMRKEQEEFNTFRNTTLLSSDGRSVADNAFMEDQLFEQQMKDKRDSDEVTLDMIKEVQELLSRFGIPYVTAPMEAEAQCAELLQLKLVDGIITDDSDVFLFGGTKIYKNMFHEKNYVEFYDAESILKLLGLDRKNMIELAQLLGSDYTNGLKGMGPVSSIEVIAEFGNLENFKDWYNNGQFDKHKQETENKFEKDLRKKLVNNEVMLDDDFPSVMVYDAYMRPEVDHDTTPFVWGLPDLDMLRSFMNNQLGWPYEKSDEILIPLIRDVNNRKKKGKQKRINEFFPREYISDDKKLNTSKRVTTATGKLKKRKL